MASPTNMGQELTDRFPDKHSFVNTLDGKQRISIGHMGIMAAQNLPDCGVDFHCNGGEVQGFAADWNRLPEEILDLGAEMCRLKVNRPDERS